MIDYELSPAARAHIERTAAHIAEGIARGLEPIDIAWNISEENIKATAMRVDTRTRLLRECGYMPTCWLCKLRIYLDENMNADEGLSMDHVTPQCEGGTKENNNIKLAHRLCNSVRHCTKRSRKVRRRLENMKSRLAERERGQRLDISLSIAV